MQPMTRKQGGRWLVAALIFMAGAVATPSE